MQRSLIIIGAGTAGLAAGSYARMNGFKTTILEMADTPGGLCTSWKRKGYLFDGSVAGLAGSAPGSPLYRLWQETGVAKYCPLHYGENFGTIVFPDGRKVTIYTDVDQLESHLLANFPGESYVIYEFTGGIRKVLDLDIPFNDAKGWESVKQNTKTIISSISHLPVLMKFGSMTIRQFSSKISDPTLQTVFNNLVHFGGLDVPILTVMLPLAYAHRKMAGIPAKGWLDFARSIERRLLELGGEIHYRKRVESLLIEEGIVKGVILENGEKINSDIVLSAADGRFTRIKLLGDDLEQMNQLFNPSLLSDQPTQVNLGVAMDFSSFNGPQTYILDRKRTAAGRDHERITVHNKYYDPTAAPEGKSALTVFLDSDYVWWKNVKANLAKYREEKNHCAEMVVEVLDSYHPGLTNRVETIDVSTPLTREWYTGNWMGAMQARKPNSSMIGALLQKSPSYAYPAIRNFYMTGQWVEPWGGITTAAQSARNAIQEMCRREGIEFRTTIA